MLQEAGRMFYGDRKHWAFAKNFVVSKSPLLSQQPLIQPSKSSSFILYEINCPFWIYFSFVFAWHLLLLVMDQRTNITVAEDEDLYSTFTQADKKCERPSRSVVLPANKLRLVRAKNPSDADRLYCPSCFAHSSAKHSSHTVRRTDTRSSSSHAGQLD